MQNCPLTDRVIEIQAIVNSRLNIPQKNFPWTKIKSCVNTISATEHALEAYLDAVSDNMLMGTGIALLFGYGVLEALSIQQDALKHLCESLDITYPKDNDINRIREIRKDIGHPTDRNSQYGEIFININRISSSADWISITTDYPELATNRNSAGVFGFRSVNLPELIIKQKTFFSKVLDNILQTLLSQNKDCPISEWDREVAECVVVKS